MSTFFWTATAERHAPNGSQAYAPTDSAVCRKAPQTHTLTDGQRECAIALAASLIAHYSASDEFADMGSADRARIRMDELIAGRTNQPKESHDEQA